MHCIKLRQLIDRYICQPFCGSAARLSRRLLVALPDGDVLVQAGDLLRERRGIRLRLNPVFSSS